METPKSLRGVGPHTACVLLSLWAEGKMVFSLIEFRYLVIILSQFLEDLEDIRAKQFLHR